VLGDLDGDGFDEFLILDPGLPQLNPAARAAFWLLSSRDWSCRGGDVDLPPTVGAMSAFLLPDQVGDGCLDFALVEEGSLWSSFPFPGGLAVYSGANATQLRTITLRPNEIMLGAWCVCAGTLGRVAWLTRDGKSTTVAVHTEGSATTVRTLECAALGLEAVERAISLDADEARAADKLAVIGKGWDRTGFACNVVVLCGPGFGSSRERWDFPAKCGIQVIPCRGQDGERLAVILGGQRARVVGTADGSVKMDVPTGDLPASSACILPGAADARGLLLLGMDHENLDAGRIDEYALYIAESTRSIQPRNTDGHQFGSALGVVRPGTSSLPVLAVGTDCRMGGCEGGVLLVDPRDGHELGRISRVSRSQLHLRE
jgi:hypothetical protein